VSKNNFRGCCLSVLQATDKGFQSLKVEDWVEDWASELEDLNKLKGVDSGCRPRRLPGEDCLCRMVAWRQHC
jgi:hypothetical protein